MYPSVKEALEELEIARKLNPGPWVDHSRNVGLAARNIAEKIPDMNYTYNALICDGTPATGRTSFYTD